MASWTVPDLRSLMQEGGGEWAGSWASGGVAGVRGPRFTPNWALMG